MDGILRPRITMSQVIGQDVVLSPRASPNAHAWLPQEEATLNMLTGSPLCILGDMPILCSAGVSTPQALELMRQAGFPVTGKIYRFKHSADYLPRLRRLGAQGKRIYLSHVHAASDIEAGRCLVPPAVLSFLNNKASYDELVEADCLPKRRIVPTSRLAAALSRERLPFVVKGVTDESSGGGFDVVLCRTTEDVRKAMTLFQSLSQVVVEEFIPILRNLCLNYAVNAAGTITYLGCAEQVVDEQGRYLGNWIGMGIEAPAQAIAIGDAIVREGCKRGYLGFVGMDMAVMEHGKVLVFDLNFRLNGSTATLVLAESLQAHLGQPLFRLRRLTGTGTYQEMLKAIVKAMDQGLVWPLHSYDPLAGGTPKGRPCFSALIPGKDEEGVQGCMDKLAGLGIVP